MHSPPRIFTLCLLALLAVTTVGMAIIYWRIYGYAKLFDDFNTFRAAGLHIAANYLPAVYNIDVLRGHIQQDNLKEFAFFLNPPTGLFIVYPLGLMGPVSGLLFWTSIQFLMLGIALNAPYFRRLFTPESPAPIPTPLLLAVTVSAFCLQNVLFGQLAGFCTALFLCVLGWRHARPALAGIALGIFSFKPQLGLLLPLLLLIEKNWKCLGFAFLTALLMALLSLALWGHQLWHDYADMLALRSRFLAQDPSLLFVISSSVYAAIRNFGASATTALAAQGIVAAITILAIWPVLKKGREYDKILMLSFASYLVTPYALVYDMPLLAIPTALFLRRAEADKIRLSQLIALLLLVLMPLMTVLLQIRHIPYGVIAIGVGLIVARNLALRETKG